MLQKLGLFARVTIAVAAIALAASVVINPSRGSQASCVMPTSGTVSGLTLVNDINACNGSILSLYSGASAPGSPTSGMLWYNSSTSFIQQYDGASWLNLWFVDASNHLTTPPIGGGIPTAALSSGSTTELGSVPQAFKLINGTTTINSFGSSATPGTIHVLKFTGILTLTYNATSMILPGGLSITTAANDMAFALHLGSGNWQVLYSPATGQAVTNSALPIGTILYGDFMTLPSKTAYGAGQAIARSSFPGYLAAVTRTQSMTRTSGNATLAAVTNTLGFGVGMPVEGPGIAAGCTIASLVENTSITLNNSTCVTASGSASITVFGTGYGSGGDSTTVGVKDCRGSAVAGIDRVPPFGDANRLTVTYWGSTNNTLNGRGTSSESVTMAAANLISHTHTNSLTDPGHFHDYSVHTTTANAGAGAPFTYVDTAPGSVVPNTTTKATGISITNAAAGFVSPTPMRTIQPTVLSFCVVVVSP